MERAEPARPSGAGVHAECFRPLGSARLGLEAESQRDVRRLEPERQLRQRHRRIRRGPSLMPRFLIQREIPDAAALSPADLKAISQRSCAVLRQLGPEIQWVQSFVTEDKITCVYIAPNAELIREHARRGGFPADRVLEVAAIIDPTTAESNDLAATARL